MPLGLMLGIAVLLVLASVLIPPLTQRYGRAGRRRRVAARAPAVAIAAATPGDVVRVVGVVRAAGAPLQLPFVGREVVFHATEIVNTASPAAAKVSRVCPFFIEDASGRARIAEGSVMDLVSAQADSGVVDTEDPELRALLGGDRELGRGAATALVWRQQFLAVGDRVSLFGRAELAPVAPELVVRPVDGAVTVVVERDD